jgi:hypothetical protein
MDLMDLHHAVTLKGLVMETWILADPDAVAKYYGKDFRASALPPASSNLETVRKETVEQSLNNATRDTQKGRYEKIRHASELLARIDPGKVRAQCARCDRLFVTVRGIIGDSL